MNTVAITGTVATTPNYCVRAYVPTTDFDVTVDFARRTYTFHIRLMNDLAKTARRYVPGDHVAVVGYLHSEPVDTPDHSVWHRVEIVGFEVEHQPAPDTQPLEIAR